MSAPWIEVDEVRTRDLEGRYAVSLAVRQASGIPETVFIHTTQEGAYSHVATADELDVVPRSRAEAVALAYPRYLASGVVKVFTTPRELGAFLDHTRLRLRELTVAWPGDSALGEPGVSRYVISGEEAEA